MVVQRLATDLLGMGPHIQRKRGIPGVTLEFTQGRICHDLEGRLPPTFLW